MLNKYLQQKIIIRNESFNIFKEARAGKAEDNKIENKSKKNK